MKKNMNIETNFLKEHETLIWNKNNAYKTFIFKRYMPYFHKMHMFNMKHIHLCFIFGNTKHIYMCFIFGIFFKQIQMVWNFPRGCLKFPEISEEINLGGGGV